MPQKSIDHAEAKSPQMHPGFHHSAVSAGKSDDYLVGQSTGDPSNDISDESSEEHEASCSARPVVGRRCQNFGKGVERDDSRRAAERENKSSL